MMILPASGSLKRLTCTSWRFERTFETPLADLDRFAAVIVQSLPELKGAVLTVDTVVFPPTHPPADLGAEAWRALARDTDVRASSPHAARSLLVAALADWLDFFFIPDPKRVVIIADHDEYCTLASNKRAELDRVCEILVASGFRPVEDYRRRPASLPAAKA